MKPTFDSVDVSLTKDRRVLIVEDDEAVAKVQARILQKQGWEVATATTVGEAVAKLLGKAGASVVLCDINLPGASGLEFLGLIRSYDFDVPVLLTTAAPSITSAVDAVHLGAIDYLSKPIDPADLCLHVERAYNLGQLAALKRSVLRSGGHEAQQANRLALEGRFDRAMIALYLVYQPIFDLKSHAVVAFETLMRSREPDLQNPLAILEAAERLGRTREIGRRVRQLAADAVAHAPGAIDIFVNLHPEEIADPDLRRANSPLGAVSSRIVLEITERETLGDLSDPKASANALRALGFRLAIDDLGAGYAGLTSFAVLEPEVVKLDMALIRDIDKEPMKRHLVETMVSLCRRLSMRVVAEGIETGAELAVVTEIGCDLGQGYYLGRPHPEFSTPTFPQA